MSVIENILPIKMNNNFKLRNEIGHAGASVSVHAFRKLQRRIPTYLCTYGRIQSHPLYYILTPGSIVG